MYQDDNDEEYFGRDICPECGARNCDGSCPVCGAVWSWTLGRPEGIHVRARKDGSYFILAKDGRNEDDMIEAVIAKSGYDPDYVIVRTVGPFDTTYQLTLKWFR